MSTISEKSSSNAAKIYQLVCKITGKEGDDVTPHFKYALRILQNGFSEKYSEQEIVDEIKRHLLRTKREEDALRFSQLNSKLVSNTILKDRGSILQFLYFLKDSNSQDTKSKLKISAEGLLDAPFRLSQLSAVGIEKRRKSETENKAAYEHVEKPLPNENNIAGSEHKYEALRSFWQGHPAGVPINKTPIKVAGEHHIGREVSESVILRELLYAFQAINGKIIRFDYGKDAVWIDPKAGLTEPVKQQVLKLAELGWLFSKVNNYWLSVNNHQCGQVEQSFAAALHNEIIEYYRLLAVLESQMQQEDEHVSSCNVGVTLSSLRFWALDPIRRFIYLGSLIDTCKGLKGGALASAIYSYHIHGDPILRNLIKNIWSVVSVPIFKMLRRWVIEGELDDLYGEFFVVAEPGVSKDRLWDEKYRLKEAMVPSFITVEQAYKILSTGKSINFLKHVCLAVTPLQQKSTVSRIIENTCAESVFTHDRDGDLHKIIDVTYQETSRHLLNVINTTYKFMDHLKAMRRYLLLGQGDFIRHLMDLLEPHLSKSANNLYMQNLSGILDNAIRSTNAQFDDSEILKRLDNRLMEVSAGDCGWDIYTLDYKIDGPIATVFTPKIMSLYHQLFHYLWKAKRMEYSLSEMWLNQMAFTRELKVISELSPILHQCHILTSEMVHFIQQMQYYITFEVMECSWDVLERKVKVAEDFDKVIIAHEEFLETIICRALLDNSSDDLQTQLQTIYNLIIKFKTILDDFYKAAMAEVNLRQSNKESILKFQECDSYDEKVHAEKERQAQFLSKVVLPTKTELRILSASYQDMVRKFLLMLTINRDVNLQFLSFRLDFNGHYKKQDSRLHTSLTFQKRRQSKLH
ncbi:Gamma-tubulin complex component 3 [Chamberlinius hualienensis]